MVWETNAPEHPLAEVQYASLLGQLSRLRRLDTSRLTQEQVTERVRRVMHGYTTNVMPLPLNGLFRARKNVGEALFEKTSDLWYPPSHLVGRGRFNHPGQSVFYAADKGFAAVFEIRPQKGDLVTLMVAHAKKQIDFLTCAHIGLAAGRSPDLKGTQETFLPSANIRVQSLLRQHKVTSRWRLVDRFLTDMATARFDDAVATEKYKITVAIGEVLKITPKVNALLYPSVATQLTCNNLCMPPEIADEVFVPAQFWLIRIEERVEVPEPGRLRHRVTFLRRSRIVGEGKIVWGEPLENVQPHDVEHLM